MSPRCKHGGDPSTSRASLNFTLAHLTGIAVAFVHATYLIPDQPAICFFVWKTRIGPCLVQTRALIRHCPSHSTTRPTPKVASTSSINLFSTAIAINSRLSSLWTFSILDKGADQGRRRILTSDCTGCSTSVGHRCIGPSASFPMSLVGRLGRFALEEVMRI